MFEFGLLYIVSVFFAGILMFLAPCTLPLVPAFLAFISGIRSEDMRNLTRAKPVHRQIVINSVAFVTGFSIVFVSFGILAGLLGAELGLFRTILAYVGGIFIIIFGLMMLNLITINPLLKEHKLRLPNALKPGNPFSAFLIGCTFAVGWTPCVGPILASVLLLAATTHTALTGAFLLLVFSLGLAVPFLLTAFFYSQAQTLIPGMQNISLWTTRVGGVFLISIGVLLITDNFDLTVQYGYQLFNWLGVSGLFNHL